MHFKLDQTRVPGRHELVNEVFMVIVMSEDELWLTLSVEDTFNDTDRVEVLCCEKYKIAPQNS